MPCASAYWFACRSYSTTGPIADITACAFALMFASLTRLFTSKAMSYRSLSIGACHMLFVLANAFVSVVRFAAIPFFIAVPKLSTAVFNASQRASTATAEKVLSSSALAAEATATWSAVMFGFAASWASTLSYSMPSQPTYSCEAASAVAWPRHRLAISIEAMLQPS